MTKWDFDMIDREEYARVCEENHRLKIELEAYKKGKGIDGVREMERLSEERKQEHDRLVRGPFA